MTKSHQSYIAQPRTRSTNLRPNSTDNTKARSSPVLQTSRTAAPSVDDNECPIKTINKVTSSCARTSAAKDTISQESQPGAKLSAIPKPSANGATISMEDNNIASINSVSAHDSDRAHINRKKKEIVHKIMTEVFQPLFNQWLDTTFGSNAEEAVDGESGNPRRSSRSANDQPSNGRGIGASNAGGERSSNTNGAGDSGSGDKDDNQKKGSGGKRKRGGRETEKRGLACPYYKHDPEKYRSARYCCGPGWPDMHRLKEHLYRRHAMAFMCRRCYDIFDDDAGLEAHLRSEEPCTINKEPVPDGFDRSQWEKLKQRSKPGTDQEKWNRVFDILFPGKPAPSPYYDSDLELSDRASKKPRTLDQFERYLTQHLPALVEQELEVEVEKELSGVEANMKVKLVEIFCNIQHKLIRTFRYAHANHTPCTDNNSEHSQNGQNASDVSDGPKIDAVGDAIEQSLISPSQLLENFNSDISCMLEDGTFSLDQYLGSHAISDLFDGDCSSTFDRDSGYGTVLSGDGYSVDLAEQAAVDLSRYESG